MKKINIVRYGKLLPVTQTGNFGLENFHNAPVSEGFYCFNKKFVELFLVGAKIYERERYEAQIIGGTLWTHLKPKKRNMILGESGSWYLIRAEDYNKILISNYNQEVTYFKPDIGGFGTYASDHLELFCTKDTIISKPIKTFNKDKFRGEIKSSEIEDLNWQKEYDRFEYYRNYDEVRKRENEQNQIENGLLIKK